MAEQVDDGCTADHCSLLTNMGVNVKTAFSSSSSSASQGRHLSEDLAHQMRCGLGVSKEEESCRCRGRKDRQNHSGPWGHRQQTGVVIAVLFSCVTLLLSVCSSVYVLQLSKVSQWEVEDLRQRVHRLDALCGVTPRWPPASRARLFTDTDRAAPASQGSPWQQNADRPLSAMLHAHERDGSDQKVEDGHDPASVYDNGEDEDGDSLYALLLGKSRQKRSSNGKRARNGKSKTCKKLENCMKAKNNGGKVKRKCARMLKCLPPPKPPTAPMKAVHFTANFWKGERQKKFDREAPLHLQEEAQWMAQLYKDSSQPIVPMQNKGYEVVQSGLYFIYTSVMFHDVKPRQSQAVVVNGKKRFKCMDSVDYVDKNVTVQDQHKYKTCTITGVTHLKAKDRLEVQNLYAETEIDQSNDSTYWGAILLSPFELDKGR